MRELAEAYRLSPRPELLFNIGRSYEALGYAREAAGCYREFITRGAPPERAELEARAAQLEHSAAMPLSETCALALPEEIVARPEPVTKPTPLYRKWWLWTVVGTVIAGVAVGTAVGLATRPPPAFPLPEVR